MPYVNPERGGAFFRAIERLRAELSAKGRWTMPGVKVGVDADLAVRGYAVDVWGVRVADGVVNSTADPVGVMSRQVRDAAWTCSEQIDSGEQPPLFDPDVYGGTIHDVIASLQTPGRR